MLLKLFASLSIFIVMITVHFGWFLLAVVQTLLYKPRAVVDHFKENADFLVKLYETVLQPWEKTSGI